MLRILPAFCSGKTRQGPSSCEYAVPVSATSQAATSARYKREALYLASTGSSGRGGRSCLLQFLDPSQPFFIRFGSIQTKALKINNKQLTHVIAFALKPETLGSFGYLEAKTKSARLVLCQLGIAMQRRIKVPGEVFLLIGIGFVIIFCYCTFSLHVLASFLPRKISLSQRENLLGLLV